MWPFIRSHGLIPLGIYAITLQSLQARARLFRKPPQILQISIRSTGARERARTRVPACFAAGRGGGDYFLWHPNEGPEHIGGTVVVERSERLSERGLQALFLPKAKYYPMVLVAVFALLNGPAVLWPGCFRSWSLCFLL